MKHLSHFAAELVLTFAITAMLWGGIALLLAQQRSDLISSARHDTENLARAFEENTAHSIDAADQVLLFLRSLYMRNPDRFDFEGWNENVHNSDGLLLQIAILGKDGVVIATNLGPVLGGRMDLSDREHFRVQRDTTADQLFISKPVRGRESGRSSIQLTRKILAADGSFNGVIVASIDPLILSRFYGSVDIGRGFVVLAGQDNIIRAGIPANRIVLGEPLLDRAMLEAVKQNDRATIAYIDHTGEPLIMSYRCISRYGLIIGVALNQNDVLAKYNSNRQNYIFAGLVLSLLFFSVAVLNVQNKQKLLKTRSDLLASQEVLTDTLENMSQGIIMVDASGKIAVINRRAIDMLGLPEKLLTVNICFDDLVQWQAENGEFGSERRRSGDENNTRWNLPGSSSIFEKIRPNGTVIEVRSVRFGNERIVRTLTDVTERHQYEKKIAYLAHHDSLTGLTNRAMFHEKLSHAIKSSDDASFAVLCLDLDHFKLINDVWGHAAGDQLLSTVADRLRSTIRADDLVARFGGDEFAVMQANVTDPEQVRHLARRLINNLSRPYNLLDRQLSVGVSIGVAIYPADGRDYEDLLKNADIALYAAKANGRGTCQFFSADMTRRLQDRVELERDLAEAINQERIEVYYQPICDAASGQIRGYEALARWKHPTKGDISPTEFITLAEETGLIIPLGLSVMRIACQTACGWPPTIGLTVNISPVQLFSIGFTESVFDVLRDTGLDPRRLGLEITEGVLISDGEAGAAVLRNLQKSGIRILLDDFGTGHAGLSYLVRFGFDCIKLDRSFVIRMIDDKAARAVIRAALVLSDDLHLDVVAEGVETEEQLGLLQELGCRKVQGYWFGAPQSARSISDRAGYADVHSGQQVRKA